MGKHSALEILIELASTQSDETAKRLGLAIRACEDSEKKLSMLLQYREDYEARFRAGMAGGISMAGYRNFQDFLEKLDTAITGQQRLVDGAKQRIETERGAWQASERKRLSFDTLATRAGRIEQLKENKRDQKMMDDHAARTVRRTNS